MEANRLKAVVTDEEIEMALSGRWSELKERLEKEKALRSAKPSVKVIVAAMRECRRATIH